MHEMQNNFQKLEKALQKMQNEKIRQEFINTL